MRMIVCTEVVVLLYAGRMQANAIHDVPPSSDFEVDEDDVVSFNKHMDMGCDYGNMESLISDWSQIKSILVKPPLVGWASGGTDLVDITLMIGLGAVEKTNGCEVLCVSQGRGRGMGVGEKVTPEWKHRPFA
jgi:hypothetical protein